MRPRDKVRQRIAELDASPAPILLKPLPAPRPRSTPTQEVVPTTGPKLREFQQQCWAMRVTGEDVDSIASKLGAPVELVNEAIVAWSEKVSAAAATINSKTLQLDRYEAMLRKVYPIAVGTDPDLMAADLPAAQRLDLTIRAQDAAHKIIKGERELLGIDAPKKVDAAVSATHSVTQELMDLIQRRSPQTVDAEAVEVIDAE